MIRLKNTPNHAGVYLSGDLHDVERLCASIREIVGEDGEYKGYAQVRLRILQFCDTLTAAVKEEQEIILVSNGLKETHSRGTTLTAVQENNVYFQIPILWSELLFIGFLLNEFIELSAKNNKHYWDIIPATVRQFQGVIAEQLEKTIGENKFRLLKSSLTPTFIGYYQNYIVQYIDYLAVEFLKNQIDDRQAAVSILARRIAIKDNNYIQIKRRVEKEASRQISSISEVQLFEIDKETINW